MLRGIKAIESFQLITKFLSQTLLGTYRCGEKMAFIPQSLFLLVLNEEDGGVILSVVITSNQGFQEVSGGAAQISISRTQSMPRLTLIA